MDKEIAKRVQEAIEQLRSSMDGDIDLEKMDPVAKMMLVALLHEEQKIRDYIDAVPSRVAQRFCSDFIPYEKVGALPAITLLHPTFRVKSNLDIVPVGAGAAFSYKTPKCKMPLNYIPVFETVLFPYSDLFVLTNQKMEHQAGTYPVRTDAINKVWIGISTELELESLKGLSLLIKGTHGVCPNHIYVVTENRNSENVELEFSTMKEIENLTMLEPFDAQQASGQFFSFVNRWKECLLNMEDATLLYITDGINDRDLFKPYAYPKNFQQWLEDEALDLFKGRTLWLQMDFPEEYVVPETFNVTVNVLPVVNVDVNSLTLTKSSPIAKLQKQENSFFLQKLETSTATHKQGFNLSSDEVIIRDFDASCYHDGDLYRDVRNLYNRFLDDYYAFTEYNGIKDGEVLRHLRETINRLGKSVGDSNDKFKFDSGTYAMRNISVDSDTSSTKVSYMTTLGELGNSPQVGETMDNKKLPAIDQKVQVLVPAMGGADKASVDARYELLRYYTLTNDRLYTRMDVDAFLRKEIMTTFGREEFHRIFIRISLEGAGGEHRLQRGLYIDIEFKDASNYEHAVEISFDTLMQQRITNLSCISMPIIVKLKNLEG